MRIGHGQQDHQQHRDAQHAKHGGDGAAQAEVAVADHHRQVDHVGAGQDLRHGPVFDELLVGDPLAAVHQLALYHGQHAAKALQRQNGEGPEQFPQIGWPLQGWGMRWGRRRGSGHVLSLSCAPMVRPACHRKHARVIAERDAVIRP
ncbi:hypothetical protein SDC9_169745 [bioreactor metagenome]|uniref:Uncharacterized protein n=1 Tax=bioreactor metagenome TaxID=1076179 RepID=A0A645G8R5_9ZZZZ